MAEYYEDEKTTIHHGDCLEVMADMPAESVDAIVTDPPYGLGFMGREWDALPPGKEWAEACLRVLKPGGHLLAFGGSRTWHRLAVAIEDGGFEMRDSIAWLYGAGFPKSLDVSKAIDKSRGQNRERQLAFTAWMRSTGITAREISDATGTATMAGHLLAKSAQPAIATADLFDKLRPLLPEVPEEIERLVAERTGIEWTDYVKREVLSERPAFGIGGNGTYGGHAPGAVARETTSHTPEAAQWEGWGTALKPAFEPVVVARKPLIGTVAANVLEHGTGAINIDATRIGTDEDTSRPNGRTAIWNEGGTSKPGTGGGAPSGRWPANVVLDESQAAELDQQSGEASRFFYCAKAPKAERPNVDGTAHPTVKPLKLMQWLVRLVTPPGGTVLDPFAGSGTTLEAATLEGFQSIGIELTDEYLPLIQHRIERATETTMF